MHATAGAGPNNFQELGFNPSLPFECYGSNYSSYHLCLPKCMLVGNQNQKQSHDLNLDTPPGIQVSQAFVVPNAQLTGNLLTATAGRGKQNTEAEILYFTQICYSMALCRKQEKDGPVQRSDLEEFMFFCISGKPGKGIWICKYKTRNQRDKSSPFGSRVGKAVQAEFQEHHCFGLKQYGISLLKINAVTFSVIPPVAILVKTSRSPFICTLSFF